MITGYAGFMILFLSNLTFGFLIRFCHVESSTF